MKLFTVWMTGIRHAMCENLRERLKFILTELKIEDKSESAILNVAKESTKVSNRKAFFSNNRGENGSSHLFRYMFSTASLELLLAILILTRK